MAIVGGPTGRAPPQATPASPTGGAGPALTSALDQAGLLGAGQDPTKVARELVKNLLSRGFAGGTGQLSKQVFTALSAFQKSSGLPVTGRLDAGTLKLLGALGLLPGQKAGAPASDKFERPPPVRQATEKDQVAGASTQAAKESATEALSARLGTLAGALRQAGEGLLGSLGLGGKKGEAAGDGSKQPGTVDKAGRGEAQAASQQAATAQATTTNNAAPRGFAASDQHVPQARADALGDQSPTTKGTKGEPDAVKGRGKVGDKKGRIGDGVDEDGARRQGSGEDGVDGEGEPGDEDEAGNAPSGDDDWADFDRGHAHTDARTGDEAGHYQVPSLEQQMREALSRLSRDEAQTNRAATYSLSVTFLKPGIYGPGQKAEELLVAEVQSAEAFDPAWDHLIEGLEKLALRHEPGAAVPLREDIGHAIRRARYSS